MRFFILIKSRFPCLNSLNVNNLHLQFISNLAMSDSYYCGWRASPQALETCMEHEHNKEIVIDDGRKRKEGTLGESL